MKIKAIVCSLAVIFCASVFAGNTPATLEMARNEALVQSSLNNVLDKITNEGTTKSWVYFTDKGFSSYSEYDNRIAETAMGLTERAKARRLVTRGENNLIDFYDIPVCQSYVDQVLATGAKHRRTLKWFNAVTVEATKEQLEQIASLPFVLKFKPVIDNKVSNYIDKYDPSALDIPLTSSTLNYGFAQTQLEQMNVIPAHELGFAGQDVLVSMFDVGYRQEHIAFQAAINDGRLLTQWDFINNDGNTDLEDGDNADQASHGTVTWSTLGGAVDEYLYGPAYLADFCLAKTEDVTSETHGEEDNWAAAAEWADSLGVQVISASLGYRYNMSDGGYSYEDMNGDSAIVTQAADLAASRGITIATAMGNEGYYGAGSLIAPSDADSVISCGAVQTSDDIAGFSGLGPTYDDRTKPEVCALGQETACADPSNMDGFTTSSGTSLSTPLIGGACAVLLTAHPGWTPMMVREALMMTATDPDDPDNEYGWGIINVGAALYYHPEGSIIIDHTPLIYFPSGLDNNVVDAEITGGAGIDQSAVYLYYRVDENNDFSQVSMYGDGDTYQGIIPGLDNGYVQYYISASDINGATEVWPLGAPNKFFTVYIDSTSFNDSFDNGLNYWAAEGTNGVWSLCSDLTNTGTIALTDSPYRNYENSADFTITSKFVLPLGSAQSATLSFMRRHILQSNHDYVYIEVSTDYGENWTQLSTVISGTELNFIETSVDLSSYVGNNVIIRFRLTSDSSSPRDGIYIDDLRIEWDNAVGIEDGEESLPMEFSLAQNYPNPFNPSTAIQFSLSESGTTELIVYDILGQKVRTLVSETMTAGQHQVIWDGADASGSQVASGMYFYKLTSGNYTEVKRMMMVK